VLLNHDEGATLTAYFFAFKRWVGLCFPLFDEQGF
jgi:hypothetical protein